MNYYIKFNDLENYLSIDSYNEMYGHKEYIKIIFSEEQKDSNLTLLNKGFKIYEKEIIKEIDEEGHEIEIEVYNEIKDFSDYTLLYNQIGENEVQFTNDDTVWSIIYLYDPETTYVERVYIGNLEEAVETYGFEYYVIMKQGNTAEVCEDTIRPPYDEEGNYLYKVVNGEVVPVE